MRRCAPLLLVLALSCGDCLAPASTGIPCEGDRDCGGGLKCIDGMCAAPEGGASRDTGTDDAAATVDAAADDRPAGDGGGLDNPVTADAGALEASQSDSGASDLHTAPDSVSWDAAASADATAPDALPADTTAAADTPTIADSAVADDARSPDTASPPDAWSPDLSPPPDAAAPDSAPPPFTCGDTLVDTRDGHSYGTQQFGGACWMTDGLNHGSRIAGVDEPSDNGVIEKWCYDDLEASCSADGALYQGQEAVGWTTAEPTQGICPAGWHIPTATEMCSLMLTLDASSDCGIDYGFIGTDLGDQLKVGGSGFDLLLLGSRSCVDGAFINGDQMGAFWTSTVHSDTGDPLMYELRASAGDARAYRAFSNGRCWGGSVRCVRDPG